jgi:hypothetical protein
MKPHAIALSLVLSSGIVTAQTFNYYLFGFLLVSILTGLSGCSSSPAQTPQRNLLPSMS